jgi:murein DD-endopeptidase MepM/ murein hydrolase activator NlpD
MTFKGVKTTLVSTLFFAVCSTITVSYAQPSHNKVKPAELITSNEAAEEITVSESFYTNWNSAHVMIARTDYNSLPENLPVNLKEGNSEFVFPVKGQLLGQFCYRGRVPHTGVDIALRKGTPVYSSFDGVVRMAKSYGGYGKLVVVRHLNGLETVYAHLSKIKVKVNQKVKAGDIVGLGGRTGKATANHLHFETRFNGAAFDPMLMMDFGTYDLKNDTLVLHRVDFLPKFKIIRSRKRGKSAVSINYDENGRQITKAAALTNLPQETSINATDSLDAKLSVSKVAPRVVKNNVSAKNAKYVVVRKGDTLGHIAQRNGTTVKRLTQINGISTKKLLQPGKRIRVR